MVVDTSVVISILKGEPGSADFFAAIAATETVLIGAPNLFEASMVFVSQANGDLTEIDAFAAVSVYASSRSARTSTAMLRSLSAATARGGIRRG